MNLKTLVTIALICLLMLISIPAIAQDHSRGWENGPVVVVTEVDTHDGMFNAYINDLNNVWRKFMERQIEDGYVLDYGMFSNVSAREGEPDLYLTTTYKNWAAFDAGNEYFEKIGAEIMGSMDDMREAGVDRGELRTIMGTQMLQQINFIDEE